MVRHEIFEMTTPVDVEAVRELVRRYVLWLFDSFPEETEDLSSYYSPERLRQALEEVGTEYAPPFGLALVGRRDGEPVGCVLAHRIEVRTAEIKRLFVDPSARGTGLGSDLVETVLAKMRALGCERVRLDTAVFLTDAISLYRRLGFEEIEPYAELPIGARRRALFMERRL